MNLVVLIANTTREVEIQYTNSGTPVSKFGVAVNKKTKNKNGELIEKTLFIDVVVWGRMAEIANQYLKKGDKVGIRGELTYETWKAQDGTSRSKHVVTASELELLSQHKQQPQQQQGGYHQPQGGYYQQQGGYYQQDEGAYRGRVEI
jgi:single-strand DNA-binding protein